MQEIQDVFISYGRRDSLEFAAKLNHSLVDRGLNVWFDYDDIPLGVDYQKQIDDGIERTDNFLFIISPHSINSPYCRLEVELALKHQKRIIPLLHVEKISYETWQERNPGGGNEAWAEYQAKGLHDHFQNMHPTIRKINWIYAREGKDSFDAAVAGLLDIFDRHKEYVRQHTTFLIKALEWERQQKRSLYLLTGEDRLKAEDWLKVRFKDSQPPCIPTDLHCEFITESRKNADNLMTEVFLSYAEEDRTTAEKIRNSLRREGFTVWMSTTDIHAGADFQQVIDRGIEDADNIVYLLSSAAVRSSWCQHELDYALALHKRIIPVRAEAVDPESIPPGIQGLQYIDLTDNLQETDYQQDESQLVRILRQDAVYHETHKLLLTKALKWERQQHNPTILLRGYNLHQAEAWLKVATQTPAYPPLPLQKTFIEESLRQPPGVSLDVFVSYSRADSGFARKLNDALQVHGKSTWFDQESIASGSDFQQEIYRGIENSDNFLFILSPRSVHSPYCADEVEYAAKLNKRFITVLHQAVNPADLHPELAKVQWIDFNQQDGDFYANFNQLLRTLDTDRDHVHNHTKWLQRAIEWQNHNQGTDLLLRGSEFAIAENWLQEATQGKKQPPATQLQTHFIHASRDAIQAITRQEKQRLVVLRSLLGAMTVVAGIAVFASVAAFNSQQKAVESQQRATQGEIKALLQTFKVQLTLGRGLDALVAGLQAARKFQDGGQVVKDSALQAQVVAALQQGFYSIREQNRLSSFEGSVQDMVLSPDGRLFATKDEGGIKLWQINGTFQADLENLNRQDLDNTFIQFSADSQTIVTFTETKARKNAIKVWGLDGKPRSQFQGKNGFKAAQFSPDGRSVVTFDGKLTQLWQLNGKEIKTLDGADPKKLSVLFSQDGGTLATTAPGSTSDRQIVKLWQRDGSPISTFETEEKSFPQAVSRDGSLVVMWDDKTLKLQRSDGTILSTLPESTVPNAFLYQVELSPDDRTIAAIYNDKGGGNKNGVKLWRRNGELRASLSGHEQWILNLEFSPDSQQVATASQDKTVRLWDLDGKPIMTLAGHGDWVNQIEFTPDGKTLLSRSSDDGTLRFWRTDSSLLKKWDSDRTIFSPNGKAFATGIDEGPIALWRMDGSLIATLIQRSEGRATMRFSRDGKTVLTGISSSNSYGPVQLWNGDGKLIQTLVEKTQTLAGQDDVYYRWNFVLSEDGAILITNPGNPNFYGPVQVWNRSGNLVATLIERTQDQEDQDWVSPQVYLSSNGKTIVTNLQSSSFYGPVQVWNHNGKLVATLIEKTQKPDDQDWAFLNVHLSRDGKTIVTAPRSSSSYGPVKLWNGQGQLQKTLMEAIPSNSTKSFNTKISEDSQLILTTVNGSDNRGVVKLWQANGTLLKTLVDQSGVEGSVIADFARSDERAGTTAPQRIITAVSQGAVQLWNTDGTLLSTVTETLDSDGSSDLKLSPDGQILAIRTHPKKIQLWDTKGKFLQSISYRGFISRSLFSANSQMFVSGSSDNTMQLWDRSTNAVVSLFDHSSGVTQLYFDSQSNNLVAASEKGSVMLFPLDSLVDLQSWITRSCQHLSAYLKVSTNENDRRLCEGYLPEASQPNRNP